MCANAAKSDGSFVGRKKLSVEGTTSLRNSRTGRGGIRVYDRGSTAMDADTDTSFVEDDLERVGDGARLVVEEPGRAPRMVSLVPGIPVRVGRADDLEISLDDQRVSREHAVFEFDGTNVLLRDLASSNGTFVGPHRIEGSIRIGRGDVVRTGSTRIAVVLATHPSPPLAIRAASVHDNPKDFVAVDPATVSLLALVKRLAASELPVLVHGETGSGKEVVARTLHRYSARAGRPFVAINCATLPESLAESELFGHERGAFTGATSRKVGLFERANGGTLMLDEVGELSIGNQARLLRVLQERVIQRLGSTEAIEVSVRVIAATNRDLVAAVARGQFREDLYFRLNGVTVSVSPLRSRPRDILPLVERVLAERGGGYTLGPGVAGTLQSYRWPGNVRELRNAIEYAVAFTQEREIRLEHLPPQLRGEDGADARDNTSPLREKVGDVERGAIISALETAGWNQSRAARELGISRRALIYKMERYGLKPRPAQGGES
jgi:DNA-binding NtrC family response regulator